MPDIRARTHNVPVYMKISICVFIHAFLPHNNPEPFILSSRDWSKHGKVLDEQVPTEQREKTVSKTEGKRSTPEVSALSPGIRKRERQTLEFVKVIH